MNTKLVATFDPSGSEGSKYNHFVINKKNTAINGGIYVLKGIKPPEEIVIVLSPFQVSPLTPVVEKEENENAER